MWEDLIASFPTGLQGKVRATIDGLRQRNAVNSIQDLAQLDPAKLAQMIAAVTGDDPATDRDDAKRSTLARTLIAAAKSLAPRSTTIEPVPAINLAGTKLGDRLVKQQAALAKSGIRSWGDLRKAARNPQVLKDAGFSAQDISTLAEFADLARIFPPGVAIALLDGGLDSLESLSDISAEVYRKQLEQSGQDPDTVAYESERFERLKPVLQSGSNPAMITGIGLDLAGLTSLSRKEIKSLRRAGIQTLADYATRGARVAITQQVREILDGLVRLAPLGIAGNRAKELLAAGIKSSYDLSQLDDNRQKALARRLGVDAEEVQMLVQQAAVQVALATTYLVKGWWPANQPVAAEEEGIDLGSGIVLDPTLALRPRICNECPEPASKISLFAYFLYLVKQSGRKLDALEDILLQPLTQLSPQSGDEQVCQVMLCSEVLYKAISQAISQATTREEQLRLSRILLHYGVLIPVSAIVGALRSGELILDDLLEAVARAVQGVDLESLQQRLRQMVVIDPWLQDRYHLVPERQLTTVELNTILGFLQERFTGLITQDSRFANASRDRVREEAARQIRQLNDCFSYVVERNFLKQALGLSERALYNRFYIEPDLAPCEQISRLDQAIRSLQAYLDSQAGGVPSYIQYAQWRGERLGELHPELNLLVRDDILFDSAELLDRGSIIRNHTIQAPVLRRELKNVRTALSKARVGSIRQADQQDIFEKQMTELKNESFYTDFLRGLDVIDTVLDANEFAFESAQALAVDEPGLALAKLQQSLDKLDDLDEALYVSGVYYEGLTAQPRYEEILSLAPRERREILDLASKQLTIATKPIFLPKREATFSPLGLDNALNAGVQGWRESGRGRFAEDGTSLLRRKTRSRHDRTEMRYSSRDVEDFSFSFDFRVKDWGSATQFELGVGFRLQGQDGQAGYRIAILSKPFKDQNGESQSMHQNLALQVGNAGGDFLNLADPKRVPLGGWVREVGGSDIKLDHSYTMQIIARGARLEGTLRVTRDISLPIGRVIDNTWDRGDLSIFVKGTVEVEFSNFNFRVVTTRGDFPPFHTPRGDNLDQWEANRDLLDDLIYLAHQNMAEPMSQNFIHPPLTEVANQFQSRRLRGLTRAGEELKIVFAPGEASVHLVRLRNLLERCLVLSYYLRFAVIPMRMSQAYLALGEYEKAANMLHVLYDDQAAGPEERVIYPFFTVNPRSPHSIESGTDVQAMRLRLGGVYLHWAEFLFRQNTVESRFAARRMYERVLQLHYVTDCNCDQRRSQAVAHAARLAHASAANNANSVGMQLVRQIVTSPIALDLAAFEKVKSLADAESLIATARTGHADKLRNLTFDQLSGQGVQLIHIAEAQLFALDQVQQYPTQRAVQASVAASPAQVALCTPENPRLVQQVREACQLLSLLQSCSNILGLRDSLIPEMRFETLLRISRAFTDLAHATERDLLNFRQAAENEAFTLLQSQAGLAQAEIESAIENQNVQLAEGDYLLAGLQVGQSQAAADHFQIIVDQDLFESERAALAAAEGAAQLATVGAVLNFIATPASVVSSIVAENPAQIAGLPGSILAGASDALSKQASAKAMQASLERQRQNFAFQLEQSNWNQSIAEQNQIQAGGRLEVAYQRHQLASLRQALAFDSLQYLSHKRLNAAAWSELTRMAREQYRRRLTYAIAAAYQAERALAFELQDKALRIIRFDYFDPRRDGLLGATQLQTDLTTLENLKLTQTRRKLQLSKTISLAQAMPVALELFRNGATLPDGRQLLPGRLRFSTLMEWFDQDFPGHYMRLITSVKVTVVALVPPTAGIRATLRNSGISRIVVGLPYAPSFQEQVIRRNPEAIALSAPYQASGLFVLDYRDELLLPFEGSGVASDWVFELPKAANSFDYDTIADVLITIEYTALESASYRSQVIQKFNPQVQAERLVSIKNEFADAWYDLHNPDQIGDANRRMKAIIEIAPSDFPPNLVRLSGQNTRLPDVKIDQVQFYVVRKENENFEIPVKLKLKPTGGVEIDGGTASTSGGLISTRQNSGNPWKSNLQGKLPVGRWEFDLAGDATDLDGQGQAITYPILNTFRDDKIEDILLVITYTGRLPDWP